LNRRESSGFFKFMKIAAFLLLLAGWALVLSALSLLTRAVPRDAFVVAGVAVEALGLVLAVRAHLTPRRNEN
jgi:hypothetical protein